MTVYDQHRIWISTKKDRCCPRKVDLEELMRALKIEDKKTDNNLLISQRERTTGPYNKETKEYGSLGRSITIPHQPSRYKNMVQGGNANQGIMDI